MNYDKLVKHIESWKHYSATYYTRDEVTKIITEPVTHVSVIDKTTDDEYDIVNDRGSWVISCDRAEATGLAELCMILNLFDEDEE